MTETTARWLDVDAACKYVSMRESIFLRAVEAGKLPKPTYALGARTPRWDRHEIDARIEGQKHTQTVREAVDGVVAEIKAKGATRRAAQEARRNNQRIPLRSIQA